MLLKKSTTVKQIFIVAALSATVLAIGCNNNEKKETTEMPVLTAPATMDSIAPATAPVKDSIPKKRDTALIRPTKTPTKAPTN